MNRFLPLAIPILMSAACSPQTVRLAATVAHPTAVAVQVDTGNLHVFDPETELALGR